MKALIYIKNNPQKALFICFTVLVIASIFTIIFPGYKEVVSFDENYEPIFEQHSAGSLFYTISSELNSIESIFFIISLTLYFLAIVATVTIFIIKKHTLPLICTFLPYLIIAIIRMSITINNYLAVIEIPDIDISGSVNFSPVMTVDIFIVLFAFISITIDIARLVHYLKTHPRAPRAPRPPRPRKPTDKERIAELEKRISELEDMKKDG